MSVHGAEAEGTLAARPHPAYGSDLTGAASARVWFAVGRLLDDLVEATLTLPDFERCLLILAAPGRGPVPAWQAALWAGQDGDVVPVPAPWFGYEAVIKAREPDERWDHVSVLVQADPEDSRLRFTHVRCDRADVRLLGLLFDPESARRLLYPA